MNTQKITVIYHSADFDGMFCREIARKFLPDAELIGWDYGNPKLDFPAEGQVYVLDLSPECFKLTTDNLPMMAVGTTEVFAGTYNRLIWIDHHKSAIDKYPASIPGYRIDGVAACRLAWQWFSADHTDFVVQCNGLPEKQAFVGRNVKEPLAVRLAGEYNIWDKRNPNAELFQMGLRSRKLTFDLWEILLQNPTSPQGERRGLAEITVEALLYDGEGIQFYVREQNAAIIARQGFDLEWEGLKFLACNHAMFNSHLFTAGIKPEHDALFGFRFDGKEFHVSLYHVPGKEHHDLSKLAVKHGGGGHKGACGFRSKKLPFLP